MDPSPSPPLESLSRFQILGMMGATALILLAIAKLWMWWGEVPLLNVTLSWEGGAMGLALALGIVAASGGVYRLWPAYRHCADSYLAFVLRPLAWPDLLWLGLLPGLSEELLFRGVMLSALGLNALAVVISGCVFGVLHLSSPQQWPYVVWATLVGLVLGYAAIATGNLWVPIVAHVVTNWLSGGWWKVNHRSLT